MGRPHSVARVGIGLEYQFQPPEVLRRLAARFAHRLSHVSIVSLIDRYEATTFRSIFPALPCIHHLSNVSPGDADGPHLSRLAELDALSVVLDAVWCGEDIGAWCIGPYAIPYFAPPLFERDVARLIGERVATVMAHASVPFLAEIPACNFVAGRLSIGEFFHEIVERSGVRLVLDVSHVFAYALYRGQSAHDVLRSLPLDAVWEVHVAGGRVDRDLPYLYVDTHIDPILPEVESLLDAAVAGCPELRAVTYEFTAGASDDIVDSDLTRVERVLGERDFTPRIARKEAELSCAQ